MPKTRDRVRDDSISYARTIGIHASDRFELAKKVEKGFPYKSFVELRRQIQLTNQLLADLVQISERTLTRRKKEGRLKPDESERLLRYSRLLDMAIELFEGDRRAAHEWLSRGNRALGGRTPLEASKTEVGAREVENLVVRLEHGVFT